MSACAWCSNQVVTCTVYMHTIGYDNNVSPYCSNVTTRLCTCTCTDMQVCGHIPAVRTDLNHRCVGDMCTLISIATVICLVQQGTTQLYTASQNGHTKTVQVLLDCGASVDKPDKV